MKKRYLLSLLALTLFLGFAGQTSYQAEEEMPRPTDVEPNFF
ncbi:MAG: hypothetical protein ACE3JQ_12075 [Paenisporosarcina sp.]